MVHMLHGIRVEYSGGNVNLFTTRFSISNWSHRHNNRVVTETSDHHEITASVRSNTTGVEIQRETDHEVEYTLPLSNLANFSSSHCIFTATIFHVGSF